MTLTAFIYAIPRREESGVGATRSCSGEVEDNGNAKKTVAVLDDGDDEDDDGQRPLARPDAFVSRPCVDVHTWTSEKSEYLVAL